MPCAPVVGAGPACVEDVLVQVRHLLASARTRSKDTPALVHLTVLLVCCKGRAGELSAVALLPCRPAPRTPPSSSSMRSTPLGGRAGAAAAWGGTTSARTR